MRGTASSVDHGGAHGKHHRAWARHNQWVVERVRVVGNSGSGKTHFARRLALRLGVPQLELDAVHHLPGWREAPLGQFTTDVQRFLDDSERTAGGWVVDGNYASRIGDLLDTADTVVWLDYSRRLVMTRVVRRTFGRRLLARELWNGNRERWRSMLSTDPHENIMLWAWTRHATYRERYQQAAAAAAPTTRWVRLRHRRAAERWLRELPPGTGAT